MLELFWEMRQQSRIAEAKQHAQETRHIAKDTQRQIDELEDRIDHLTMITAAIWTLLQQRTGMSNQQLLDQVQAIDLSDGQLDGRVRKDTRPCSKCRRAIAPRHLRCIYCGEQASQVDPFDRLMS